MFDGANTYPAKLVPVCRSQPNIRVIGEIGKSPSFIMKNLTDNPVKLEKPENSVFKCHYEIAPIETRRSEMQMILILDVNHSIFLCMVL